MDQVLSFIGYILALTLLLFVVFSMIGNRRQIQASSLFSPDLNLSVANSDEDSGDLGSL